MSEPCAHLTPRSSYDDPLPCTTPPSHVIYVDVASPEGWYEPDDRDGIYVCAHHTGSIVGLLATTEPQSVFHIIPLVGGEDPS